MTHPVQGAAPTIDREAETLEPTAAPPAPPAPPAPGDAPMPVAENAPPFVFQPTPGLSSLDMAEILTMNWVIITGQRPALPKGGLRNLVMPLDRFEQLSDQAQQHFRQVIPSA